MKPYRTMSRVACSWYMAKDSFDYFYFFAFSKEVLALLMWLSWNLTEDNLMFTHEKSFCRSLLRPLFCNVYGSRFFSLQLAFTCSVQRIHWNDHRLKLFGWTQVPRATTIHSQSDCTLNKNTSHLIRRANDINLQNWPIGARLGDLLWQWGLVEEYKTVSNRNSSLYSDTIFYNTVT